ncbi:Gldg family protein [Marispirochaeta aestuarii]|uniref:GldG family protein n=1 Tax=Marispirochaeta aestuarii TaxID=1963862 RepID=UPI002ABDDB00|nr:Gldg family protein [Marispirochaeta aestuarii]
MKIKEYLASERSNRLLLLVVIVLVNLVCLDWFFRIDLTEGNTYSLSSVSRETIATLREPLTVSVFFSRDLPAPYNTVARYVRDLLAEYDSLGNPNFRYQLVDMESDEGRETADSYGIRSVQVQEVRSDEFQSRNAFMGIAVSYADEVAQLQEITGTEGLEYRITTTISRLVGTVEAAAALDDKVETVLYYSPALASYRIAGFDELEDLVTEAVQAVNAEKNGILDLRVETVDQDAAVASLGEQYGFQRISYPDQDNPGRNRQATVGMVLRLGDRFETLPLDLSQQLFGGYALAGLSNIQERIEGALEGLLSNNPAVGYLTGHGEKALDDSQRGAGIFRNLSSDLYEFREINLKQDEIPAGINTLIINGPKSPIPEKELYALDQFLMRGGSLMVLADPYEIVQTQNAPPSYLPISHGLTKMLSRYGVELEQNILLDKNAYTVRQQFGEMPLYYVPLLEKKSLDQEHPITKNLGQVAFFAASSLNGAENPPAEVDLRVLARSSDEAWTMEDPIDLNPMGMSPPADSELQSYPLMILAEGYFPSYFKGPLETEVLDEGISGSRHIERGIRRGKLLVAGSSELTGAQLVDPQGTSPNAILIQNMLDYMNGNEELPLTRSKGLNLMPLGDTSPRYRSFVKGFAMVGMPLLVIVAGLLVWRLREARRRNIRRTFTGEGKREVEK